MSEMGSAYSSPASPNRHARSHGTAFRQRRSVMTLTICLDRSASPVATLAGFAARAIETKPPLKRRSGNTMCRLGRFFHLVGSTTPPSRLFAAPV